MTASSIIRCTERKGRYLSTHCPFLAGRHGPRYALRKVLFLKGRSPMLDITKDIQSLTTFRRRSGDFMKQLKKSKRPVVLTVKGKAEAIVQDAGAYQRLLDIAARADAREGIRQGLDESRRGKGQDAEAFFAEFEASHGLSR